jgi:hypothetical protein
MEKVELFDENKSLTIEICDNEFYLILNGKKVKHLRIGLTSKFIRKLIAILENEKQKELERNKTFFIFCFSHKYSLVGKKSRNLLLLYFHMFPAFYKRLGFLARILNPIKCAKFKLSDSVREEWLKQLKEFAKLNNIVYINNEED